MKPFRWSHEKNEQLKVERAISFEEMVLSIEADGLLDILKHPDRGKYQNQLIFVVVSYDYVYLVPLLLRRRIIAF
jgi:hypothetical protein